jgi:2-polyprenyl-3-methyl-5-hydroxy-6-metoxy-1,4-benzoquinol methylase
MTDPAYFVRVRKEILPLMSPVKRCLEVGCASGRTLEWLRAKQLIEWAGGIDIERNLDMSPLDFFESGDVETVSLPGDLDAVLCLDVLEHLRDPKKLLVRLHESLNPTGFLITSIPNVANFRVAIPLLFGKWDYRDSGILDRTHLRFFTRRTAVELLESSGFRVEMIRSNAFGLDVPMRLLTFGKVPMFHAQYLLKARKC